MKRIYKYLTGLLLLPLLLASCAGDKMRPINEEEAGMPGLVRFTLSSNLRATGDPNATRPVPALDREKSISKLYAVVYNKNDRSHYKTVECTSPARNNTYEFDNKKGGEFFFFLIANPGTELEKKLKQNPATPEALGQLIATQSPGEDKEATNFLMTSKEVNVTVNVATSTTIANKIALERVAARFDFYNKINGLVITKITFGKRYTSTHLFPQVGKMSALTSTTDKVYDGSLFENEALKATIYGYETDTPDETFFTLEGTYKGDRITPETVKLDNFVIKRNHLYNIILCDVGGGVDPDDPSKPFGKLKYEIKVADWEEGEILTFNEEEMKEKSQFLSFDVEVENASFLTPYLKDSPSEVYTTQNNGINVRVMVHTYGAEGDLKIDSSKPSGVTLGVDSKTTDPATGMITKTYKMSIPERDPIPLATRNGNPKLPKDWNYEKIPIVVTNATGETIKRCLLKHGRIKMPVEHLTFASMVDESARLYRGGKRPTGGGGIGGGKLPPIDPLNPYPINPGLPGGDPSLPTPDWGKTFLTRDEAIGKYKDCEFDGIAYHMPTDYLELNSVILDLPYYWEISSVKGIIGRKCFEESTNSFEDVVYFPSLKEKRITTETDYSNNVYNKGVAITYALRFKNERELGYGNHLQMAYRYVWEGDFEEVEVHVPEDFERATSKFHIESRYLGPQWKGTLDDIRKDDFWNNDAATISRFEFKPAIAISQAGQVFVLANLCQIIWNASDTHLHGYISHETAKTTLQPRAYGNDRDFPLRNVDVMKHVAAPVILFSDK